MTRSPASLHKQDCSLDDLVDGFQDEFKRLIDSVSDDIDEVSAYRAGCRFESRGDLDSAIMFYSLTARKFPVSISDSEKDRRFGSMVYTALGRVHLLKGDLAQASRFIYKANTILKDDVEYVEARFWLGELYFQYGQFDKAGEVFDFVGQVWYRPDLSNRAIGRLEDIEMIASKKYA